MRSIFLIILSLFVGCNYHHKVTENAQNHEKLIMIISEKSIHSSIYISIPIWYEDEYKQAVITNTELYYEFYIPLFSQEITFKEYILKLFADEIKIKAENISPLFIFPVRKNHIEIEYSKKGFYFLVKKYLREQNENTYILEKDLTEHELFTLIKICFNNNVIVTFDSYEGYFIFRVLSSKEKN